jgi:glycoside hydrolase-like protein
MVDGPDPGDEPVPPDEPIAAELLAPLPGVDYAFSRPNIAQLAAAGKRFACRYGGPGSLSKQLSPGEAQALAAAGIAIVANAEGAAEGLLGGWSTGVSWAQDAEAHFAACGMPASRPIYFSVDFDVQSGQWAAVASALRGAASVVGASRVGVYGGRRAIEWARRDGAAAWFWQTYAWSGGVWVPGNHIEQYQNGVSLAGATLDLDRALTDDFGQWGTGEGMPTEGERNVGYMIQNAMVGVQEPEFDIPAESGFPALRLGNPFGVILHAMMSGTDAHIPAFANRPGRTWTNATARDLAEIKRMLENITVPPVEVDYARLAEALRPIVAQETEAAIRRVLGGLDE